MRKPPTRIVRASRRQEAGSAQAASTPPCPTNRTSASTHSGAVEAAARTSAQTLTAVPSGSPKRRPRSSTVPARAGRSCAPVRTRRSPARPAARRPAAHGARRNGPAPIRAATACKRNRESMGPRAARGLPRRDATRVQTRVPAWPPRRAAGPTESS